MLNTNLKHLTTKEELENVINTNENVMVCCGRMGPMCIPVYAAMEDLEKEYPNVQFRDMEFDIPDASVIRNLPQCRKYRGLPFTIYYKNGEVIETTSSIQSKEQIKSILDRVFK